jgi:DNA-binding MarR family transcriptional regulator
VTTGNGDGAGHEPLFSDFDLAQQALPFLLRRAHARAESLFLDIMCVDDLTPRQITILTISSQNPGATMSQLGELAATDPNTASTLVRRLLQKGLLRRRRSPSDGRAFLIEITAAGEEVLSRVLPHNAELIDAILAPLPVEYRPLFVKSLRLMIGIETSGS